MKKNIKRLLAGVISASMILSAVPVFAETEAQDVYNTEEVSERINENTETATKNAGFVDYSVFDESVELNATPVEGTRYYFRTNGSGSYFYYSGDTLYIDATKSNSSLYNISDMNSETRQYWNSLAEDSYISKVVIDNVNGFPKGMFSCLKYIKEVNILCNITYIGRGAFSGCKNLKSVYIDSMQNGYIETNAFYGCSKLSSIYLPSGLKYIGQNAFVGTKLLTDVTLPDTVEKIGIHAFGSSGLENISLPESLQEIGLGAFEETNLSTVTIPETVKNVYTEAFNDCANLKSVYLSSKTNLGGIGGLWDSAYAYGGGTLFSDADIYVDGYKEDGKSYGDDESKVHYSQELRVDDIPDQYYYGESVEPDVTVKLVNTTDGSSVSLTKDTDYKVSYEDNNGPGTGKAIVRFIGDYVKAPDIEKTFNIVSPIIEIEDISEQIYYAVPLKPVVSVYDNTSTSTKLVEGTDYRVSYSNNNAVGTGIATITMLGKYAKMGSIAKNFSIVNPALSIDGIEDQMYVGEPVEPKVFVSDFSNNSELVEGVDYTVEYENNNAPGTGIANILYKGRYAKYSGDVTSQEFVIQEWNIDLVPDSSININAKDGSIKVYANDNAYSPFNANSEFGLEGYGPGGCYYDSSLGQGVAGVGGVRLEYAIPGGGTYTLVEGKDFYNEGYSCDNNTGIGAVGLVGIGKFTGITSGTYTVHPYDLSLLRSDERVLDLWINDKYTGNQTATYNYGNPACPYGEDITLFSFQYYDYDAKEFVSCDIDSVDMSTNKWAMNGYYKNNIDVGTATVVIEGLGPCFTGSLEFDFPIKPRDISGFLMDTSSIYDTTYIGNPVEPPVYIYADDESPNLVEGTDYFLEYEDNTAPGLGTVIAHGIGNYTGENRTQFSIRELKLPDYEDINLRNVDIEVSDEYTYDGEEKQPKPVVNYTYIVPSTGYKKDFVLEEGEDYTLRYENNVNAGTASVFIDPIEGRSKNGKDKEFDIYAANLSDVTAQDISDKFYTGNEIEPELSLSFNGMDLVKNTDYEVIFENNDAVGTATAKIVGIGNYSGELSKDFNIIAALFSADTIAIADIPDEEFNKLPHTPEPEVKMGDKVLVKDVDFEYSYGNNVNAGTANITVTGKGNYEGSVDSTFTIKRRNGSLFVYYLLFFEEEDE